MPNIITGTELAMLSQKTINFKSSFSSFGNVAIRNATNGVKMELEKFSGRKTSFTTIFLSHSHSEKVMLESMLSVLLRLGVEVYVDWLDEEMPYPPTGKTAERIKEKIEENHKFILLATNNAIASKWCNWELGLGDAAKFDEHIALFPVAESNGWRGNEYLQIYPYIEKVNSISNDGNFKVTKPDGTSKKLEAWLKE